MELFSRISRQFLEQHPLRSIDFSLLPTLNLDLQAELLSTTLYHPISLRYPPSPSYRRDFAKKVLIAIRLIVDIRVGREEGFRG
jgi:hypothetical protein